jgi:hypothetical protein
MSPDIVLGLLGAAAVAALVVYQQVLLPRGIARLDPTNAFLAALPLVGATACGLAAAGIRLAESAGLPLALAAILPAAAAAALGISSAAFVGPFVGDMRRTCLALERRRVLDVWLGIDSATKARVAVVALEGEEGVVTYFMDGGHVTLLGGGHVADTLVTRVNPWARHWLGRMRRVLVPLVDCAAEGRDPAAARRMVRLDDLLGR